MSHGLHLSDDMIFTSRITCTARALGLSVQTARSADALMTLAAQQAPTCVLIDLHNSGLDLPELLRRLTAVCRVLPRIVAYGSHVDAALLKAARAAGCDLVLPRSKFVEDLEAELPNWLRDD